MMKRILLFLLLGQIAIISQAQYLRRDNMQAFDYVLDNGFDRINLTQTQEVPKSFFLKGTPQIFITSKNGKYAKNKNLLVTCTAFYQGTKDTDLKVYAMKTPMFTGEFIRDVMGYPTNTAILIGELKLSIIEPGNNSNQSKKQAAFYLYLK